VAVPSSSSIWVGSQEVSKAGRRRFTSDYKARIVQEADRCREAGEIGGLLRREGLFSSQLAEWRKQYRAGAKKALSARRGRKVGRSTDKLEIERLQKEVEKLRDELEHAVKIIALQKKVAELLGRPIPAASGDRD
jgi:transposase-like protein